jgi:hypothetical protein
MPSFNLIKPYGQRYKNAENSLQHHTTQAHKSRLKPTKTSLLERQDRSCINEVADHQRETPGGDREQTSSSSIAERGSLPSCPGSEGTEPSADGDVSPRTGGLQFERTLENSHTAFTLRRAYRRSKASTWTSMRRESTGAATELERTESRERQELGYLPTRAPRRQPPNRHLSPLRRRTLDGASKEGTTPMAPPPPNPADFGLSPGAGVGVREDGTSVARPG